MEEKATFLNGRQITKIQNAKKCLAFYDEMKPASNDSFASLHAEGELVDGIRAYSRIKLQLLDYSAGTGDKTKKAEFNLSPEQVLYIKDAIEREVMAWKMAQYVGPMFVTVTQKVNRIVIMANYIKACFKTKEHLAEATKEISLIEAYSGMEYRQDKIISKTVGSDGRSPMTRFSITRTPYAPDGSVMKSPWKISIDKGTAIAAYNSAGGSYAKSGTFVSDNKGALTFNASDEDMLTALIKVAHTIDVFEKVVCGSTYKKGKAEQQEAIHQSRKQ